MHRKMMVMLAVVAVAVMLILPGCGNVYMWGDAMTAAETSALDAHQFSKRVKKDPNMPAFVGAYADENYKQWRSLVRSGKADAEWGPLLDGETAGQ